MPRLKADAALAAAARFDGLLAAGRMQQGLTIGEMCARAGFSERTFETRRAEPKRYRLEEVEKLSRIVGIPFRELLGALVPSFDEKKGEIRNESIGQ